MAILGVGNELRGDDAAGVVLVRALQRQIGRVPEGVLLLDAGCAPENFVGTLRRFEPKVVLLIDAAQLDESPGTLRVLDVAQAQGALSTHSFSPRLFARYISTALPCEILILGIQPSDTALGAPLSPRVRLQIHRAARAIVALLESGERNAAHLLRK